MKKILLSTNPEWVAKVLNLEKDVEIRKTAPTCDLPIEVIIYCTKGKYLFAPNGWNEHWWVQKYFNGEGKYNGKVVAKFTLKSVHKYDWRLVANPFFKVRGSCLSYSQLREYATDPEGKIHDLFGWHIDDLEIFDEPKELSEFKRWKEYPSCEKCPHADDGNDTAVCENHCRELLTVKRAPESFCYIEID